MKITIFGVGYVGLVTGACLAEVGNDVLCVDIDQGKINELLAGNVPFYEPGLSDLVSKGIASGKLKFTTDALTGVAHGNVLFIAVGTPSDGDGSADLQYILEVAKTIGKHINEYRVVVTKSTVPVGSADKVLRTIDDALKTRGESVEFDIVSNPEFLKEGAAIGDFMKPDRIIVGAKSDRALKLLRNLYAPFSRNHEKLFEMDIRSAELTKYAANAMLATKISFMTEIANLADQLGADIESIRTGSGSDPRIGYHFIYPGCGYGGSCFPKDVRALVHMAGEVGYSGQLLAAVNDVNNRQKMRLFDKISKQFDGDLEGKVFAFWGLAFKPNTDDMREAPSRNLMEALWEKGAKVQAHDPISMEETKRIYGSRDDLMLVNSPEDALANADALVITTEWNVFRSPDFDRLKKLLKNPIIFDGRNLYNPDDMKNQGIIYYGIGRGASLG